MNSRLRQYLLLALTGLPLSAGTISIGFLSEDLDSPVFGQNTITLNNYTGPGCGVDFASCTPVTITGTLAVVLQSGSVNVDVTSVPYGATNLFTYSALDSLVSATFTGTIAESTLTLFDSSTFIATQPITAELLFSDPGIALLTVTDGLTSPTPEPSFGLGIVLAAAAIAAKAKRS